MNYAIVTLSLKMIIASKNVINGAVFITIAISVSLKNLTAMKLTNIEKLPAMTLIDSGYIVSRVMLSIRTSFKSLFRIKINIRQLIADR